jgi:hypothetical protein
MNATMVEQRSGIQRNLSTVYVRRDTKERGVKKVIIISINMKAYIRNLKAHIYPHITTKSPFIRNHVFLTNQYIN